MSKHKGFTILLADDDEDDCLMAKEALQEAKLLNEVHFVKDGEELMDYLHHRGRYIDRERFPLPGLILLDLNMPKKDGRQALKEIKGAPELKDIPIVVFTTSKEDTDIIRSYDLGVVSYVTKPVTFDGLVEVMRSLLHYQLNIVKLPE
ncbi:MAG: response regulator [Nitrospiraceae bacterium]|nr:MAG: response regulator [Nitrospiraceae bacterium]